MVCLFATENRLVGAAQSYRTRQVPWSAATVALVAPVPPVVAAAGGAGVVVPDVAPGPPPVSVGVQAELDSAAAPSPMRTSLLMVIAVPYRRAADRPRA